jgi:hypothetical protein
MVMAAWRLALRRASSAHAQLRNTNRYHALPAWRSVSSARTSEAAPAPTTTRRPTIALTAAESSLFDFLLYVQHQHAPTTQLRVAGGWVRDKLRGAESEDIDIVLDNLYGKEFANHIIRFQRRRKLPTSSVGVVKANSDKVRSLSLPAAGFQWY